MNKFLLLFLIMIGSITLSCQTNRLEIFAGAGDFFNSQNVSLSWTLGECITETFSQNNILLTQGFQQGKYLINRIEESTENRVVFNVYPVPTSDLLNIKIINNNSGKVIFNYALIDLHGNVLTSKKDNINSAQLDISKYPSGAYQLKLSTDEIILQTYKIQIIK